ncbi:MAG: conjugal transfer protein TrbI [Candidatus Adiutrix sp.]|nr:conjugal transfer protein TrbI [Candidatus Adiutrix sp.]
MAKNNNAGASPNSFEPPEPKGSGSQRAYYAIIGVLAALALVVIMSLSESGDNKKETAEKAEKAAEVNDRRFLAGEDAGRGVAAGKFPKPPEEQQSGLIGNTAKEETPPAKPELQFKPVGPPAVDKEAEARRQEEMEERRRKREAYRAGLNSKLLAGRGHKTSAEVAEAGDGAKAKGSSSDALSAPAASEAYDPAADKDKEAFFERADVRQWRSPYTREAGARYELKTGAVVPGIMVTGINSDLPGNIIAQVSQNVYDSARGDELLIPQGAKIYGAYDSRIAYGQSRILVAWNRIIFPDGSAVALGAMPGADMGGSGGFADLVDNHYLRIFGSAALMSLITGGMSYAIDQVDNNSGNQNANNTTLQDEMASALANQMGQTSMKLLEKNMSIKPTIEIRPGFRFNIVVTKDIVFRGPYAAAR